MVISFLTHYINILLLCLTQKFLCSFIDNSESIPEVEHSNAAYTVINKIVEIPVEVREEEEKNVWIVLQHCQKLNKASPPILVSLHKTES
jgi:hypothetical protein